MKIMFSAGEVSGDLHGAKLAEEILSRRHQAELVGFGGDAMEKAGVRLFENFKSYNVMGVLEVLMNIGRILRLLNFLSAKMEEERPDLLVLIDYPDFNWRLAKRAKALGIPVFSYIPPSAWAWRRGRAKKCAEIAKEFVAVFPFELPPYEEAGANISFLGNPLVDTVKGELSPREAKKIFGLDDGEGKESREEHIVLLLPGSRLQEIERLLPVMLSAAELIEEERRDTLFFLPVAHGVPEDVLEEKIKKTKVRVTLTREHRYDLMALADCAIATSGTVVMEAALMGLPCVVLYKMAPFNYFLGKLLVSTKLFSLPNILLNKAVQRELLQDEVTPERIKDEILPLYRGESRRDEVIRELKKACSLLGEPGAAGRIAEKIIANAEKTGVAHEKL